MNKKTKPVIISELYYIVSEDVSYFCHSCDVQNRKAKKAKRQSQAKDKKARTSTTVMDGRKT